MSLSAWVRVLFKKVVIPYDGSHGVFKSAVQTQQVLLFCFQGGSDVCGEPPGGCDVDRGITLAAKTYIRASRKEPAPPVRGVMACLGRQAETFKKGVSIEGLWTGGSFHALSDCLISPLTKTVFAFWMSYCAVIMLNISLSVWHWHCDLLPPHPPSSPTAPFIGMFSQDLSQLFSLNAFGPCTIDQPDTLVSSSEPLFFQHT